MPETPILAVDLDGTLLRTDTLHESFWAALGRDPLAALAALGRIRAGRAALKAALARAAPVDAAALPYREEVLALLRDWRAAGGRTLLVTAADRRWAEAVAGHLGLFDEVHASDGTANLRGEAKAALLAGRFGARGFAYAGDSPADLPVWAQAAEAITVAAPPALRRQAEAAAPRARHLGGGEEGGRAGARLRALRPHQWLKNLLVFLPALAAHDLAPATLAAALLAFLAFSLVASGVYVLNDLLDLAADRAHPRKRRRPFASGAVPIAQGGPMAAGLLLAGLLAGAATGSAAFLGTLLLYWLLTLAYSLVLKRRLVIDICALAGLYTLRVMAGGAATGLPLSPWLVAFSIFVFLALAAVKRQAELVDGLASGRDRAAGRAYRSEDLPVVATMALAAGYVAVLVLALYVDSVQAGGLYGRPELLWGACPVLLYWLSRMVMLAHRGQMHDDPVVFAVQDGVSRICGLAIAGTALAAALA